MKALYKSRTVWVAGLLAACSTVTALGDFLPPKVVAIASAISGAAILFFRIADKRTFDKIVAGKAAMKAEPKALAQPAAADKTEGKDA